LIGCEDIAKEAESAPLGPEDKIPSRLGRAARLVPVYQAPKKAPA
jgi:hypothetical protein